MTRSHIGRISTSRAPSSVRVRYPFSRMQCETLSMEKLTMPAPGTNLNASDAVLAQTIGAHSGWVIDSAGRIYDSRTVIISESLFELAKGMRQLGWFTPREARTTGVFWNALPVEDERGDAVRSVIR